ncbi:tryptophan synthase subunit alpha [Campylobacter sp. VicNov18]|uniref:tryptophan synthase subunit alpha n=1 Tax=Campylobacter bilis TaxID=2691918 RepID=UPI00130EB41B|nr:tryptophan synthase subunit alpha [Campylobacter bilis]MPV63296.1 tryptophan synthase subunit alpha [Campylobacter hepaticus]MBM0636795.1 tryptophan synthase subunit alpha [Campylobacter bilis]MCC8277367.1 tryptophan synthase subunit alpha [Campylobacter bilis]MCC8299110.1 tryptophan synthase subunit alpha [Campylobacter bilis]MCC8300276.1 tryptophan synthase subunit alpha [Campylobacter bilis]
MVDFRQFYKENANVAYMVLGYPNLETSKAFLQNLDQSPIDILELGIAYSDPIADGELISDAAKKALDEGADIYSVFELLSGIKTKKALIFMVYYSLIFSYGLKSFVKKAKSLGICALIVPELSFEESYDLDKECQKYGIILISFVSITTPKERVEKLVKNAKGFIYLLASIGITGTKSVEEKILQDKVKQIRTFTNLPIFIGFGIKNNQDVKKMRKIADGVIVGTSVVECFKYENVDMIMQGIEEIFKK